MFLVSSQFQLLISHMTKTDQVTTNISPSPAYTLIRSLPLFSSSSSYFLVTFNYTHRKCVRWMIEATNKGRESRRRGGLHHHRGGRYAFNYHVSSKQRTNGRKGENGVPCVLYEDTSMCGIVLRKFIVYIYIKYAASFMCVYRYKYLTASMSDTSSMVSQLPVRVGDASSFIFWLWETWHASTVMERRCTLNSCFIAVPLQQFRVHHTHASANPSGETQEKGARKSRTLGNWRK